MKPTSTQIRTKFSVSEFVSRTDQAVSLPFFWLMLTLGTKSTKWSHAILGKRSTRTQSCQSKFLLINIQLELIPLSNSKKPKLKGYTDPYTRDPLGEMMSLVGTLYNCCFLFGPGTFLQHTECRCRYRLHPCNSTPKDIALKRSVS